MPVSREDLERYQGIVAKLSRPIPLAYKAPPKERKAWKGAKVGDTFQLSVNYHHPSVGHVPAGQWWSIVSITEEGAMLHCTRADPHTLDVSRCKLSASWLWSDEWQPTWRKVNKREVTKWASSVTREESSAGTATAASPPMTESIGNGSPSTCESLASPINGTPAPAPTAEETVF